LDAEKRPNLARLLLQRHPVDARHEAEHDDLHISITNVMAGLVQAYPGHPRLGRILSIGLQSAFVRSLLVDEI
jgi:hypothetical protein